MSLERKDLRLKLSSEMLEAVRIFADIEGKDMGEFCEDILVKHLNGEITKSMIVAARCQRAGLTGKPGES